MITLGAPAGGRSGSIAEKVDAGSLASYMIGPVYGRSWIGKTARLRAAAPMAPR